MVHAGFGEFLAMLRDVLFWVKLTGLYQMSAEAPCRCVRTKLLVGLTSGAASLQLLGSGLVQHQKLMMAASWTLAR